LTGVAACARRRDVPDMFFAKSLRVQVVFIQLSI
jgi:hypothetical protein